MRYAGRIVLALVLLVALCGPVGAGIVEPGDLITSNNASTRSYAWNGFTDGIRKLNDKGARAKRGRRDSSVRLLPVQNVVSGTLCLGSGVNQKLAIIAKLLEPTGHVRGLILKDNG
jgi:hypothetical protein